MLPSLSLGESFANFGLAAVIGPVSVADKANSDDFDLWLDIYLACDLLRIFKCSKMLSLRVFDCHLARLATATRSRVGGGMGQNMPLLSGARSTEYPRQQCAG